MAGFRSDSLDELLANFDFARVKEYVKRRDPGTAPTDEAPVETAPAPSASMGMFMPSSAPELRARKNLAMFLEWFYTWASVTGYNSALDSDVAIKTSSGTPRAELERLYNRALVDKSLRVWQTLTKALEREPEIMKMVMKIGFPSEAWRALKKIAVETEDDAYVVVVVVCCFLTLTDPLRIQPWSQDRRNQTKSNRESETSMKSRQKRTDKK